MNTIMKIDYAKWLKEARMHSKLTQQQLADSLSVTKAAISAYETGRNQPSYEMILKISKITNYKIPIIKIESNSKIIGIIEEWDSNTELRDDEVEVPFYKEICLAAGNGFIDENEYWNGQKLRFSTTTLKRKGIASKDVVCVSIEGNSMEPVIPDGTTIGINKAEKNIRDGKIYAINHGGLLRTKILYKMPNNRIKIRSYNFEEYPDEETSLEDITILGRVFWWSVLD